MSFGDDLPEWSPGASTLTAAVLADLEQDARQAAWLLRPDETDPIVVRLVAAVPALVAALRLERARAARLLDVSPELCAAASIDCIVPNTIAADAQDAAGELERAVRAHAGRVVVVPADERRAS